MKEYSYAKRAVLRALSEDARASISSIAKLAKCSRSVAAKYVKELEDEFHLRYTIEFNKDALGFAYRYIIWVKFSSKPPKDKLIEFFKESDMVQFASFTDGNFDLVVEAETNSGKDYILWETSLAYRFAEYRPSIHPSQIVVTHIGFLSISSSMIERLDLSKYGMDDTDKKILVTLNENSRKGYREIAKEIGINEDTVRYRIMKIMSSGIVKKFSTIITKPPMEYNMILFVTYRFAPGTEKRAARARKYYMEIDGEMPLVNTFQILAPTSGSERFFMFACFESMKDAMEKGIRMHREIFKGDEPKIVYARITDVLKGYLPIRNISVKDSYNVIKWEEY